MFAARAIGNDPRFSRFALKRHQKRILFQVCKKIRVQQGNVNRKRGSGRPRTVQTPENAHRVELLLRSPPRLPSTHLSARKTAKATQISRTSVQRMAKARGLKALKKTKVHKIPIPKRRRETNEQRRARLSQDLLDIGEHLVTNGIFTDDTPFHLRGNLSTQNQRVYTSGKKRDVRAESLMLTTSHLNFEEKLMVFSAISVISFSGFLLI